MDKRTQVARSKVLSAARRLFMEHGFSSVSTEQLAMEASVSKATLYKYFADMNDVLGELLKEEESKIELGVETHSTTQEEFLRNLNKFSHNLLTFLNDPDVAKLDAMLAERGTSSPELAKRYYKASYGASLKHVSDLFEHAQEAGFIELKVDPPSFAEVFLASIEGFGFVKARFGVSKRPYPYPQKTIKTVFKLLIDPNVTKGFNLTHRT